jgi:hypothetical protein
MLATTIPPKIDLPTLDKDFWWIASINSLRAQWPLAFYFARRHLLWYIHSRLNVDSYSSFG